jgi:hypothetical protein
MSENSERTKKRYAEDEKFRKRVVAKNRAWRRKHRKEINARRRLKRLTDPEYRERQVALHHECISRLKYGLAPGDYDRMLSAQNGVCRLCKRKCYRRLCIDHCHLFNKVRALLCNNCNSGLGHFHDDPDLLREAADFLDEWFARMGVHDRGPVARPLTLATAARTRPLADARPIFSMGPPRA